MEADGRSARSHCGDRRAVQGKIRPRWSVCPADLRQLPDVLKTRRRACRCLRHCVEASASGRAARCRAVRSGSRSAARRSGGAVAAGRTPSTQCIADQHRHDMAGRWHQRQPRLAEPALDCGDPLLVPFPLSPAFAQVADRSERAGCHQRRHRELTDRRPTNWGSVDGIGACRRLFPRRFGPLFAVRPRRRALVAFWRR